MWDGRVHVAVFKMDNQQGPPVKYMGKKRTGESIRMNSRLGMPQGSGDEWGAVTANGNWVSFWVMKCSGTTQR